MIKSGLKIGFIGLGIMGSPMAGHLLHAGHTLYIHSRSKLPDELVEGGATVCANAQEVAKRAAARWPQAMAQGAGLGRDQQMAVFRGGERLPVPFGREADLPASLAALIQKP